MKSADKANRMFLALIIVFTIVISFSALDLQAATAKISLSNNSVEIGDTLTVTVSLSSKSEFTSYGIIMQFDSTNFKYQSVKDNSGLGSPTAVPNGNAINIAIVPSSNSYNGTRVAAVTFKATSKSQNSTFSLSRLTVGTEVISVSGASASVKITEKAAAAATPTPKPTAAPTAAPTSKTTAESTTKTSVTVTDKTTSATTESTVEETIETTSEAASPVEKIFSFSGSSLVKSTKEPDELDIPRGFLLLTGDDSGVPITYVLPGSDLTLFWLEDSQGEANFYFYDIDQDVYVPYQEIAYPRGAFRIALPTKNDSVPEGFVESKLILSDKEYPAFRPDPDRVMPAGIVRIPEQICLLYLQRDVEAEEGGTETEGGFYYYDQISAAIFPYAYLPLVIPETLTQEPVTTVEQSAVATDNIEAQTTTIPGEIGAETAAAAIFNGDYRTFSMILAALLLGSWLLFWALAPRRKRDRAAIAGKTEDNTDAAEIPSNSSSADAFQNLRVEEIDGSQKPASPQNNKFYRVPDENRYNDLAEVENNDYVNDEIAGSMPWYIEEEKTTKSGLRKFNPRSAHKPDTQKLEPEREKYYSDAGFRPANKKYRREVDVNAAEGAYKIGPDSTAPPPLADEISPDGVYNELDDEKFGFINPDEPEAEERFKGFRRRRIEDITEDENSRPREFDDIDDIFGDRGEI